MEKNSKQDRLHHLLLERIAFMKDGEKFPTVREIMKEYNVSQFTAAPAVKRLQDDGLIVSQVGRGSFVRKNGRQKGAKVIYFRPDGDSASLEQMTQYMTAEALKRGYSCEIVRYRFDEDVYALLGKYKADAMIVDPIRFDSFTPEQLRILTGPRCPVVLCRATFPVFHVKFVGSRLMETGMTAANYFYKLGHRKMAVLLSEGHSYTMNTMVDFFTLCARTLGCEVKVYDCRVKRGIDSRLVVKEYLDQSFDLAAFDATALFVCSHATAIVAHHWFAGHGVDIPGDLSMMCYGYDANAVADFPISSIGSPIEKQSAAVLDIIDHQLAGDYSFDCQITIAPEIIDGNSVRAVEQ